MALINTPIAGVGTSFKKYDGVSDWDVLAEITNIGGPSASREMIDVTALDTTGGYRKYIGSFRDSGAINLTMNFTNAGYTEMKDDFESATPKWYQITFLDKENTPSTNPPIAGTSIVFEGLVQELPLTIPTDAQITVDVVIKITGKFDVLDTPELDGPETLGPDA